MSDLTTEAGSIEALADAYSQAAFDCGIVRDWKPHEADKASFDRAHAAARAALMDAIRNLHTSAPEPCEKAMATEAMTDARITGLSQGGDAEIAVLAREVLRLRANVKDLETQLAYANDAAAKGDTARHILNGMSMDASAPEPRAEPAYAIDNPYGRAADWERKYIEGYEMDDGMEVDYTPSDEERILITDAVAGMSDELYAELVYAGRALTHAHRRAEGSCIRCGAPNGYKHYSNCITLLPALPGGLPSPDSVFSETKTDKP